MILRPALSEIVKAFIVISQQSHQATGRAMLWAKFSEAQAQSGWLKELLQDFTRTLDPSLDAIAAQVHMLTCCSSLVQVSSHPPSVSEHVESRRQAA